MYMKKEQEDLSKLGITEEDRKKFHRLGNASIRFMASKDKDKTKESNVDNTFDLENER